MFLNMIKKKVEYNRKVEELGLDRTTDSSFMSWAGKQGEWMWMLTGGA